MGHSQSAFFYSYPKKRNKILHLWQPTDKNMYPLKTVETKKEIELSAKQMAYDHTQNSRHVYSVLEWMHGFWMDCGLGIIAK